MLIKVVPDLKECIRAGIEPVETVEIDLAALSAEDRNLLATAVGSDMRWTRILVLPTMDGLLAGIRTCVATELAQAAAERVKIEKDRAILATRPIKESQCTYGYGAIVVPYTSVEVDTSQLCGYHYRAPEYIALRDELNKITAANRAAAKEIHDMQEHARCEAEEQARLDGIRVRAEMPLVDEDGRLCGTDFVPTSFHPGALISDDGHKIVIATDDPHHFYHLTDLKPTPDGRWTCDPSVVFSVDGAAKNHDTLVYRIEDGVVKVKSAYWVAKVIDPSAPKPVYDFCRRVPGGFEAPSLVPGDVLVWGTEKDRKGRSERHDRLVSRIEKDGAAVRMVKTDYAEARKLRKSII